MTRTRRAVVIAGVAGVVVIAAVVAIGLQNPTPHPAIRNSTPPPVPEAGRQKPPPANASGFTAAPKGSFSVTAYGADPTGTRDSTAAIQRAIDAAVAEGGWQTVYFPTGTYLLDDDNGAYQDFLLKGDTVNILGAGQGYAKVIEKVGTYAYPNLKRGKTVFVFAHMRGFYVSGLTIDAQTYNGGDTIDDYGDDSTLEHLTVLGARSGSGGTKDVDNVFDLRVLAVCNANPGNRLYGVYNYGNVVTDVVLNGRGIGANDDLDFSCQHDGSISDIVDTGWGTALYIDQDVTVDDYVFRPGGSSTALRGYFITDSQYITIDNFTSYGEGGIIKTCAEPNKNNTCLNYPSRNIVINREHMESPGFSLVVADAQDVTIENSMLDHLNITPERATDGLTVEATTYQSINCRPSRGAVIENMTGARCI
jgi:Pectate lyase superfamily protein